MWRERPGGAGAPRGLDGAAARRRAARASSWSWARRAASCASTGEVERTVTVPVQLARGPGRHLRGRPWRLLLHENFTRYTCEGRTGHGMAEFTERP